MRWTRDTAVAELRTLAAQAQELRGHQARSADHVQWIARVRGVLGDVFGTESDYYQSFVQLPWQRIGDYVIGGPGDPGASMNPGRAIARENHLAYLEQLESARGLLQAAAERITRLGLPTQPGFRHRIRAAAEEGFTEGLRVGLRNGTIALITFVVGILIGALTPISEQLQRFLGQR